MKREHIFRGQSTDTKEWVRGYYVEPCNIVYEALGYDEVLNQHNVPIAYDYAIISDTLGEWTGRTDKSGFPAYEDDVIKHSFGNDIGIIRYGEYRNPNNDSVDAKHIGFYIDWVLGECKEHLRRDLGYWLEHTTIIGNIHDNPELLRR